MIVYAPLQLAHQLFDLDGGDRIERRRRLVHEQHFGIDRERARDAQPLLLAAGERGAGLMELVLDLFPQRRAPQTLLGDLAERRASWRFAGQADPGEDVVEDRHRRKGIRPLEYHADTPAGIGRINTRCVEVVPVEQHFALDARVGDDLVHAIQTAEQGRFAATRGADQRGDQAGLETHVDVLDGLVLAVVSAQIPHLKLGRTRLRRRWLGHHDQLLLSPSSRKRGRRRPSAQRG